MDFLKKIEAPIEKLMKGLPALPKDVKDKLVIALPWVSLVFGVLEIILVWGLINFLNRYGKIYDYISSLDAEFSLALSGLDRLFIYLGAAVLVASALIGFIAYAPLKERKPKGWYLLFLAVLINLGYALLSLLIEGQGLGSFLVSALQSAFGFYLLFQVRDHYKESKKAQKPQAE